MMDLLDIVHDQMTRHIYNGASVALFKNGQWTEHYIGTIDGKTPVQPNSIYDLS